LLKHLTIHHRGVYDVKATHLGTDEFKFKAEIDFDGREVTRAYLSSVDMEQVMREIRAVQTVVSGCYGQR